LGGWGRGWEGCLLEKKWTSVRFGSTVRYLVVKS
jgi:hypothetical protein